MFKVWMEWDCGQDYLVFTTEEKARAWIDAIVKDEGFGLTEEFPNGYHDLIEETLCGIVPVYIDPPPLTS